jgi:peptidoglycan-N-acetylglucosamine deacetylase
VYQSAKLFLVSALGLSKDALHVHVGLGVYFVVAIVLRLTKANDSSLSNVGMIDWIAFLVAVVILAAVALALWTALGRHTRSTSATIGRLLLCLALALPIAGFGTWRLSNARSIQLLGTLVHRVDVSDSVVALTFDDGPTPDATLRVLNDLAGEDVRATFFLNGSSMAEHPAATRALVAAGHEIGNHSYSHPAMLGLSQERIEHEIERTDQLIREAGYGGPIHFRSPYGKKLVALPLYLSRTGRTNVLWDVEPETDPAVGRDPALIVDHVLEHVRPGSIILLHVMTRTREPSLAAVPEIVRELHARGYRFVTVSELLGVQIGAPAQPPDSAHVQAAHKVPTPLEKAASRARRALPSAMLGSPGGRAYVGRTSAMETQ